VTRIAIRVLFDRHQSADQIGPALALLTTKRQDGDREHRRAAAHDSFAIGSACVGECHLYEHKYSCLFKQLFSTPKHIKTGYSQINGLQVTPQSPQNSDEV